MKKSISILTLSASAALLAACGGGGSEGGASGVSTTTTASTTAITETSSSTNTNSTNTNSTTTDTATSTTATQSSGTGATTATTLGDCFALTPGTEFVKSDGYKKLVVQETFEGQSTYGSVELRSDDTRFGASYQTISGGYIHLLGVNQYDQGGIYNGKNVYSSSNQIPVDMTSGQTIQLNYTDTSTSTFDNTTTTTNRSYQFTFVGLENLVLGGKLFSNVCKVKISNGSSSQSSVKWFAKGFGMIRSETQDATGVTVPGSRVELTSIVAAP